jgi:DNA transformation protein
MGNEFVDYVLEQLSPLGGVRAKRMFGGHGVYLEGLFFALVADDTLYLKADDENRAQFEARGLSPFRYQRNGKERTMSYYSLPESALEDSAELLSWARRAIEAALRAAARKG